MVKYYTITVALMILLIVISISDFRIPDSKVSSSDDKPVILKKSERW